MRVYVGMPSFLNPLESIVGGNVDIELGSRWVRLKPPSGEGNSCFEGQEVVITTQPRSADDFALGGEVWFKRKHRDGGFSTVWLDRESFTQRFRELTIILENK